MPQKPAVRAKKKRRDARRLANWRAKKEQQTAQAPQGESAGAAQTRS